MKHLWLGGVVLAIGATWLYSNWDSWWFRKIVGGPGTMTIYWHDLDAGDRGKPRCPTVPPMKIDGPRFTLAKVELGVPGAPLSAGMQEHLRARGASGVKGDQTTALDCLYRFRNILFSEYWLAFKGLTAGHCRFDNETRLTSRQDTGGSCTPSWWGSCPINCGSGP